MPHCDISFHILNSFYITKGNMDIFFKTKIIKARINLAFRTFMHSKLKISVVFLALRELKVHAIFS